MFIYKEKSGNTFYLKLHVPKERADQEYERERSFSLQDEGDFALALAGEEEEGYSIIVDVFGVYKVGTEITEQLHQLLENKLASATLSVISALLLRNPLLKLTADDVAFIHQSQQPAKTLAIPLPVGLTDPFLYLLFLRQNLLLFLHRMYFAVPPPCESCEKEKQGIKDENTVLIHESHFMFLYNHISGPGASSLATEIGQGLAAIYLRIINSQGMRFAEGN